MTEQTPLQEELAPMLENVRAMHKTAQARVDELQRELREAREVANRMMAILRAAGVEAPRTGKKRTTVKTKHGNMVSTETAESVYAAAEKVVKDRGPFLTDVPNSFIAPDVIAVDGLYASKVNFALKALREQGSIRFVGKSKSDKNVSVNVWALDR